MKVMKGECDILKWHLKAILYDIFSSYSISSNEEDIFTNSEEKEYSKN
jgi:hypothetical protein